MEFLNKITGEIVGSPFYRLNYLVNRNDNFRPSDFLVIEHSRIRYRVSEMANEILFNMLAGMHPRESRDILISMNIVGPISEDKAKNMNVKNMNFSMKVANAAVSPIPLIAKRYGGNVGGVVGGVFAGAISSYLRDYIYEKMPYFNNEDVLIFSEAYVNGGIGQQYSARSDYISREYYDPIN